MEVNGWLVILALFFTVTFAIVIIIALRIDTKLDYMNKTVIRLLNHQMPPQRSATAASRTPAHRQGE